MENNQQPKGKNAWQFLQEKGYYIVLFLCVCAIGVAGYVFLSDAIGQKEEENAPALSVVTTVEENETEPTLTAPKQTEAPSEYSSDESVQEKARRIRLWPTNGPVQTEYCADVLCFNATTQDWRTHEAIDLACQEGERVLAAAEGTVTAVYDDTSYGTTVVIAHDGGYTTRYANLAQLPTVSAGTRVKAGDVIGTVGRTAMLECAQEPHLHFAVTYGGMSMDPADFLLQTEP